MENQVRKSEKIEETVFLVSLSLFILGLISYIFSLLFCEDFFIKVSLVSFVIFSIPFLIQEILIFSGFKKVSRALFCFFVLVFFPIINFAFFSELNALFNFLPNDYYGLVDINLVKSQFLLGAIFIYLIILVLAFFIKLIKKIGL